MWIDRKREIKRASNVMHTIFLCMVDSHMLHTSEVCLYVEQVEMPNYR